MILKNRRLPATGGPSTGVLGAPSHPSCLEILLRYRRTTAGVFSALLAAALVATAVPAQAQGQPSAARQQAEPNQVQGLTVSRVTGTPRWRGPGGRGHRLPDRADPARRGRHARHAGHRRRVAPNRQVNNDEPTFADAGFAPGNGFQWRVRARFGTEVQPYSAPVSGTTRGHWGDPGTPGENLRTQWEETLGAQYTSDVNEYAYTAALDGASDRVRVVEIGRTVLNRPINMLVIGYPRPAATPEAVAATNPLMVNCNVHGNEPGDREACLIMARQLAFTKDAKTLDLLSKTTMLIVPTLNGDGRAANTRGNSTGQDLNRDHSLIRQPETRALAEMVRDYRPIAGYDGHEYGNTNTGDLPMLPPRHQNVAQGIFDESQKMIEGHMYTEGARDGWWACPYGCTTGGQRGAERGDHPAQHPRPEERGQLPAGAAQLRWPDAARRVQHREQPPAQDLLRAVDVQRVPHYHGASVKGITKARAEAITCPVRQRGTHRLPGLPQDRGVPRPAPG